MFFDSLSIAVARLNFSWLTDLPLLRFEVLSMLSKNQVLFWLVAIGLAILLAAGITIGITEKHQKGHKEALAKACKSNSGAWLDKCWECEYVDQQWCTATGGRFDECGSACRHSADPATLCTMQCVPICAFSYQRTDRNDEHFAVGFLLEDHDIGPAFETR